MTLDGLHHPTMAYSTVVGSNNWLGDEGSISASQGATGGRSDPRSLHVWSALSHPPSLGDEFPVLRFYGLIIFVRDGRRLSWIQQLVDQFCGLEFCYLPLSLFPPKTPRCGTSGTDIT